MPLFLSFPTGFFLMLSSFFIFIIVCTVDMVPCGYPHLGRAALLCSVYFRHLSQVFRICPLKYGSFPSSGVMGGVKKSLSIGLLGYSFGRLVVSSLPIPSFLVKCL